ncbi:phosphotransferase [Neptuniibacter sp.]|uniref:aminoglycoside phosphotransferase family protein n=1 Tax=Neptuniibacter sp. TaxID=1962643 RepID=UPI00262A034F|nr:phosphotransferase [Neptuniibacter sp.]MCP4598494.1 phosphotransferase [Neptuniibacter sp.]
MDQRFTELKSWLEGVLPAYKEFDAEDWQLSPVSGDASFRRYFRATSAGKSWIAVDAPPEKEDSRPFIAVAEALEALGVAVPHIYKHDLELGFMLLGDFGDELYLPHLNEESADALYGDALDALLLIQRCEGLKTGPLPLYDHELLSREVELFREWFLQKLLRLELDEADHFEVDRLFHYLIDCALEQPTVFVHRDYHSRNLMYRDGKAPGVIDFQDAVKGPVTYDLVSLLRDCYIAWPDEDVYRWVEEFRVKLHENGRMMPDAKHFQRWFDLMGAQRHLKAIGIFARLNIRDDKPGYLGDIPRTMGYLLAVARKTYELEPVAAWLEQRVIPAMYASEYFPDELLQRWIKA